MNERQQEQERKRQQEQERTRIRLTVDRHSDAEPLGNGRVRVVEKITRTYEPFELTRGQIREWVDVRKVITDYGWVVELCEEDVIDGFCNQLAWGQRIFDVVEDEFRRLGFQIKE